MAKNPTAFETAFTTYTVKGQLGEGGAGRVFAVKDLDGEEFALKCLFPEHVTTQRRKRFKNEIDFCLKHQHPNVIRVRDYGLAMWNAIQCPFYVMVKFPSTLKTLIDQKIPPDKVLPIFSQILDGVESAHLLGVVHRDLKTENILCGPQTIVVADFGIAHFNEGIIATAVRTADTARMANFRYSAPEQRGKGGVTDQRADIFALGLILNEMFTKAVPQGAGYLTIERVAPAFSYLDALVEKMIQQNPDARPGSIKDIKKELIGRRNEFVALQELDAKSREVVPVGRPSPFEPISPIGRDWQDGVLIIELNRKPEDGWVARFTNPLEGFSSFGHDRPQFFTFRNNTASIRSDPKEAQDILNHFKNYVEMANCGYERDLESRAKRLEAEIRERLSQETAAAEARAKLLKNLNL